MQNQFASQMATRTNPELLKILNEQRNDYQPEPIIAAEEEFAKRNLTNNEVAAAKSKIETERNFDEKRASEPLDPGMKIACAMFPGVLQIIYSKIYIAEGYDRKARELVRWTIYGFSFYFGLVILMMMFS
jgi:hypothetical protein